MKYDENSSMSMTSVKISIINVGRFKFWVVKVGKTANRIADELSVQGNFCQVQEKSCKF